MTFSCRYIFSDQYWNYFYKLKFLQFSPHIMLASLGFLPIHSVAERILYPGNEFFPLPMGIARIFSGEHLFKIFKKIQKKFSKKFQKVFKRFSKYFSIKLRKMHYFSIFFKRLNKQSVTFLRVRTRSTWLGNFEKFRKFLMKALEKNWIFILFLFWKIC